MKLGKDQVFQVASQLFKRDLYLLCTSTVGVLRDRGSDNQVEYSGLLNPLLLPVDRVLSHQLVHKVVNQDNDLL